MRTTIKPIFLRILLPLFAGILIYYPGSYFHLPDWLRNYMPDAAWAFALAGSMMILWKDRPPLGWIAASFLLGVAVEGLQYARLLPGTPDWADLLVYALGLSAGICLPRVTTGLTPLKKKITIYHAD